MFFQTCAECNVMNQFCIDVLALLLMNICVRIIVLVQKIKQIKIYISFLHQIVLCKIMES